MPRFSWKGIDEYGTDRKGVLVASSKEELRSELLLRGVALLEAKEQGSIFPNHIFFGGVLKQREELATLFGNLALLLGRGIPLVSVLEISSGYIEGSRLKSAMDEIIIDIQGGDSFSIALGKYQRIFGTFVIPLIKAGEQSGRLEEVSSYLAKHFDGLVDISRRLRHAALLPGITIIFALLLVIGLFVGVIPQFEILFSSMSNKLPEATKYILKLQHVLTSQNIFLLMVALGGFILFIRRCFVLPSVRFWWDRYILSIFVIGKIVILINMVHFVQILSLLILSGVPLRVAMEYAANVMENTFLKKRIVLCAEIISKGESLEYALREQGGGFFPEQLMTVVSVGEKSGRIGEMLEQAARFFRKNLHARVRVMTTLFQPILLVLVGFLVGFIMLAIYMPIFDMAYITH